MQSIISDADLRVIEEQAGENSSDSAHLAKIKRRSIIVQDKKFPEKAVRLNSLVMFWHSILKKIVSIRIVLPNKADLGRKRISVFAPISMALLGLQERDQIRVRLGGIEKELRIIQVKND